MQGWALHLSYKAKELMRFYEDDSKVNIHSSYVLQTVHLVCSCNSYIPVPSYCSIYNVYEYLFTVYVSTNLSNGEVGGPFVNININRPNLGLQFCNCVSGGGGGEGGHRSS